jgi:histidyl-tRNA synthetase
LGSTKPPGGTRDFLPDEIRRRAYVIGVVRDVYERYGFEPLETPAFENIDTLLGKYGEEGNKLIFKILRRGEHEGTGDADLALRYDLTVPLARVIAQHQNELPRFFRRYQIQPVWRADRPAKGRFREFYQCDIDAIGSTSPLVEAEVLSAVCEVLARLGFADFRLRLNHRQLLTAILRKAGFPDESHPRTLVAVDKLDKIGVDGVVQELGGETSGFGRAARLLLSEFPPGRGEDVLDRAEHFIDGDDGQAAIGNLRTIVQLANGTAAAGKIVPDMSLARGLSYYTGAIMEIAVPDLAGSLGGGGRYDNLVGMFLGRDIPACGFSLGLERIIFVMNERHMFPPDVTRGAVDVMVTIWNEPSRQDALSLASELRRTGLSVEVYPDAHKIGAQLKYAAGRNVPLVTIVGEDERARDEVKIKNLRTREEHSVSRADAGARLRGILASNESASH